MSAPPTTPPNPPAPPPEQRWHGQAWPAPIVVALIARHGETAETARQDTEYLLIKRKSSPYDGRWALVGGKWDFGETLSAAIEREVREETGLEATFQAVRGIVSERVQPSEQSAYGAHFLLLVCALNVAAGRAQEQGEGSVGWFTREQIGELHDSARIIPSDYAMITAFALSTRAWDYVEAEMQASVTASGDQPMRLLRFERIGAAARADES